MVRTLPKVFPTTIGSPTFRVPCCTKRVAVDPWDLSKRASITVPIAKRLGSAFNSSTSETKRIISKSSSMFWLNLAEIGTKMVSPPHASGIKPYSVNSCMTRSGLAPGLSILLIATMIGTSAALAWLMASTVCGMTPSSAATTIIVMSVTSAPRARMVVKASWPGVSKKVINLSLILTW